MAPGLGDAAKAGAAEAMVTAGTLQATPLVNVRRERGGDVADSVIIKLVAYVAPVDLRPDIVPEGRKPEVEAVTGDSQLQEGGTQIEQASTFVVEAAKASAVPAFVSGPAALARDPDGLMPSGRVQLAHGRAEVVADRPG